jgi:hypothetical protein
VWAAGGVDEGVVGGVDEGLRLGEDEPEEVCIKIIGFKVKDI